MTSTTQTRLEAQRKSGKIYSYARGIWLVETPEESVRQEYLCTLVNEYGFKLEEIAEEVAVPSGRGAGNARADFLIWRTPKPVAAIRARVLRRPRFHPRRRQPASGYFLFLRRER